MPIRKRGTTWVVDVHLGGQRVVRSAGRGATRAEARELEAKIRRDLHAIRVGRAPERTIEQALARWLKGDARALGSYRKFLSHANALRPYIFRRPLTQAPDVAEEVKRAMLAEGLSNATVNRRLALLRRVCRLAHAEWRWLDKPILIRLLPERNERHIYLTPAEVEALARACPNPAAGDMCRLAAYTGLRRGELFALGRGNVVEGCLLLDASTKTGRPRMIPLPEAALEIASRLPLPLGDQQLRLSFEAARIAIGRPDLHFHDLRHTYASWLVQSGVHLRAVQELLGHSTLTMTQRYSHLAPEHLREAVRAMEDRHNSGVTPISRRR
jgi:integrase